MAARCEREAVEADHRVAAPVREPVVAGDHRTHIISRRSRASDIRLPPNRLDEELICGQHKLRSETLLCVAIGANKQRCTARPLHPHCLLRHQRSDDLPRLCGSDERCFAVAAEIHMEITGAPHPPPRFVSADLFYVIDELADVLAVEGKGGLVSMD